MEISCLIINLSLFTFIISPFRGFYLSLLILVMLFKFSTLYFPLSPLYFQLSPFPFHLSPFSFQLSPFNIILSTLYFPLSPLYFHLSPFPFLLSTSIHPLLFLSLLNNINSLLVCPATEVFSSALLIKYGNTSFTGP
jgi:hypothetical protein